MPSDDIPRKLMQLLMELIASGELPELAVGGAWLRVEHLLTPPSTRAGGCGGGHLRACYR
jgi:hypothetical protein